MNAKYFAAQFLLQKLLTCDDNDDSNSDSNGEESMLML
jgi:hypothetical protein